MGHQAHRLVLLLVHGIPDGRRHPLGNLGGRLTVRAPEILTGGHQVRVMGVVAM